MRRAALILFVALGLLAGPSFAAQPTDGGEHINLNDASAVKAYGDEATDYGVKPRDRLQDAAHIDSHTPMTVPGGKVITTGELVKALADPDHFILVFDVLESNGPHKPVPGAYVWTYANRPGSFKDDIEIQVKSTLDAIVQGDGWYPIVFYCAGSDCWQGYNAALRAIHAGYKNIYWYRGGAEAWSLYEASQRQAPGSSGAQTAQ